jgi:hypothetical protein
VVKLLPGHSEGTGDAEMLDEAELEEIVLEKELEEDMEVVTSELEVWVEMISLSVLWLVDEAAVSVALDVLNSELDAEVVVASADELVDVVSNIMLAEES